MVFTLAKLYERRLEHNIRRHRLDVNLAERRPKPNCSPSILIHSQAEPEKPKVSIRTSDAELLNRFINESAQAQPEVQVQQEIKPEMIEVPEFIKLDPVDFIEDLKNQPLIIKTDFLKKHNLHRAGSVESAIFTESESICSEQSA